MGTNKNIERKKALKQLDAEVKKYKKDNQEVLIAIEAMKTAQLGLYSRVPNSKVQRNYKVIIP